MTRPAAPAWWLLAAHAAMIVFSTVAMVTILASPPGDWATREPAMTVMRWSFALAGPVYVVIGALAALAFCASTLGAARALLLGGAASVLALGAELAGTSTGLPFGEYAYSGMLGPRILDLVPVPIPLSWFYMLVGSLVIVARLARPGARHSPWRWSAAAGALMVAWDISMDPAMVSTGHWRWGAGDMFRNAGLPSPVVTFFTHGAFYGMPLSNWAGWFLTATLIARVMLALVPPPTVRESLAPSRLPILLYLANGVMPVALCVRDGFWWAAIGGTAAMAVPAALALRRPVRVAGAGRAAHGA